jgi:hypothetical protein
MFNVVEVPVDFNIMEACVHTYIFSSVYKWVFFFSYKLVTFVWTYRSSAWQCGFVPTVEPVSQNFEVSFSLWLEVRATLAHPHKNITLADSLQVDHVPSQCGRVVPSGGYPR